MTLKKLLHTSILAAALMLPAACTEDFPATQPGADGAELVLTLATQSVTRATEAGEDVFNENRITKADVYFFPAATGNIGQGNCLYVQAGLVPTLSGSSTDTYDLRVPLDPAVIQSGESYYVYVVANPDAGGGPSVTVGGMLSFIKEEPLFTRWKTGYRTDGSGITNATPGDYIETALLMDGGATLTIQLPQTGTRTVVPMTRAMAKVSLSASTDASIEVGGTTYTPVPIGMFATMVYAVQRTNLAGNYAVQADNDYVTRLRRNYNPNPATTTDGKERYNQLAPFYSYPNPAGTADRRDSYLILCVPWQASTSTGYETHDYYYRVPITGTADPALLERNHYYKVNVHIGVLGSLDPKEAVEVKAEFEIMDWIGTGIDGDMQQYQYLVLDSYSTVLNNETEFDMPYISSSDIAWNVDGQRAPDGSYTHITSVVFEDYSENQSQTITLNENRQTYTSGTGNNRRTIRLSDFQVTQGQDGTLHFSHPLSDENDFVRYTITVAVYNRQGVRCQQDWVITQYPAMYIVGENNNTSESYGGRNRFVNGYDSGTPYDDNGRRNDVSLGSISGLSGTNENPNLYTIHISSFADNTYAIGDPRSETPYPFGRNGNPRLDKANQYYATRQDAENIIAPAFKVASSWGKTLPESYQRMVARCASYQEAGYPAGRWRIPTKAEVEYIIGLSEDGKIPRLFGEAGSSTAYWVSSGTYTTGNDSGDDYQEGTTGSAYVRCVYDVWYWGEATIEKESAENNPRGWDNEDFVWGDDPSGRLERGTEH